MPVTQNQEDKAEYTAVPSALSKLVEGVDLDKDEDIQPDEGDLSPREKIARGHAKKAHGFEHDKNEYEEEIKPEVEPAPEADPKEANVAPDDEKSKIDDIEMVEVKINGLTRQIEKTKVDAAGGLKSYQKEVAANEKLQKAAEDRRALDNREEELRLREVALKSQEEIFTKKSQPSTQDADNSDLPQGDQLSQKLNDKAKAYREAIYAGDDEKADTLFSELVLEARTSATKQESSEDIGAKAAQIAVSEINAQNYESRRKAAVIRFETEYSDIADDPNLRRMAHDESGSILKENPDWKDDPERVIEEAAKRTRGWLTDLKGDDGSNESTDTLKTKLAEKRALQPPKSGNGKSPSEQGKKTQSRAEYIAEMRKQRGLE